MLSREESKANVYYVAYAEGKDVYDLTAKLHTKGRAFFGDLELVKGGPVEVDSLGSVDGVAAYGGTQEFRGYLA